MVEQLFLSAFGIVTVYMAIGNYMYFRHVLPMLSADGQDVAPKFAPSAQLRQFRACFAILDRRQEHPWYYWLLYHSAAITMAMAVAVAALFAVVLIGRR